MEVQLSGYRRNTKFDFIVRNSHAETAKSQEILDQRPKHPKRVIWNLRIGISLELGYWSLELQSPKEISTSRAVCTISPFGGTSRNRLTASAIGTWRT